MTILIFSWNQSEVEAMTGNVPARLIRAQSTYKYLSGFMSFSTSVLEHTM